MANLPCGLGCTKEDGCQGNCLRKDFCFTCPSWLPDLVDTWSGTCNNKVSLHIGQICADTDRCEFHPNYEGTN